MTIPANHDEAGVAAPLTPHSVAVPAAPEQMAHDLAHLANVVGNLAYLIELHADDPAAVRRDAARLAGVAERGAALADRLAQSGRSAVSGPRRPVSAREARVTNASRPLHVLVVEDEAAGRELLGALLVSAGHRVTAAAGLREALRALDASGDRMDAIITDVGLDDGDGWELVELARQRLPGLRIGVVTGWRGPMRQANSAHADFVVGKPFRLDELLAQLSV